jgi:hypothetical protein
VRGIQAKPRLAGFCTLLRLLLLLGAFGGRRAHAQDAEAGPLTLQAVVSALRQDVGSPRVLARATELCITFRVDARAERQIREAGGTAELVAGLRGVCTANPSTTLSPATPGKDGPVAVSGDTLQDGLFAALSSAVIPGTGQMVSDRGGAGVLFMAGGLAAVTAVFYTPDVENQQSGVGEVRHPYRRYGTVAYVTIALWSSIDAYRGVRRHNRGVIDRGGARIRPLNATATPSGIEVQLMRVTF